jgi:hypothetical protein
MMNHRIIARYALILLAALSLCACNFESDSDKPATGAQGIGLTITSPITTSAMDTTDAAVDLAGSANSTNGILQVTWANNRGDEGVADGTDSWVISGVDLALGENTITVTAEDIAGDTTSKSLTVNRESGESGSATLSWTPPTSRVDGSALMNLAGYRIYYGRMPGIYDYEIDVDSAGSSTYVVEDLVSGDWFFAVAAYDADGLESERSNEVLREIS